MSQDERFSARNADARDTAQRRFIIAAQPHIFARPLIYGLEDHPEVSLQIGTPPSLADKLLCCEVSAALLPTIDLQMAGGFTVVPAGCVTAGRTLTSRIFSRVRPARLETLWVDPETHTSRVLAQVLWSHCFNTRLDILNFDPREGDFSDDVEAVLLVGDKVVSSPPLGFDWQIDLSSMWFEMTGLPFVMLVWAAGDPEECADLYRLLSRARRQGMEHLAEIAREHAAAFDWPVDLAVQNLTRHLEFEFTDAHREGMEEFFSLAADCGAIDEYIGVRYYKPTQP